MYKPVYRSWYVNYALDGDKHQPEFSYLTPSPSESHTESSSADDEESVLNITWPPKVKTAAETVEGSAIQSLFKRPVTLFSGFRRKVVKYMQFRVSRPTRALAAPLPETYYRAGRVTLQAAQRHGWSDRSSPSFRIMEDRTVAVRSGPAGRSDLLIGSVGFSSGVHLWDIYWAPDLWGMHPVVGAGSQHAVTQTKKYEPLVGLDGESYGWHLRQLCLVHNVQRMNQRKLQAYPGKQFTTLVLEEGVMDNIRMVLDMDKGTLGFIVGGNYLGHAFTGLRGRKLYPMASTTYNNALIRLRYRGSYQTEPDSLLKQALHKIKPPVIKQLEETYDLPVDFYKSKPCGDD